MVAISRPNRDALIKAIDIFRDVMRPFLIRSLERAHGLSVEEAIRQSLPNEQQALDFKRNLQQNGDLESAIDVNQFPRLVEQSLARRFLVPFQRRPNDCRKTLVHQRRHGTRCLIPPHGIWTRPTLRSASLT